MPIDGYNFTDVLKIACITETNENTGTNYYTNTYYEKNSGMIIIENVEIQRNPVGTNSGS